MIYRPTAENWWTAPGLSDVFKQMTMSANYQPWLFEFALDICEANDLFVFWQ